MIVVDSSVWIAALRAQRTPAVAQLIELSAQEPLIVGDRVMTEVLQGARDEAHAERIERNLRQHSVESMLTERIAVAATRNDRALRARGITIRRTIDLLINTFCIERRHRLLHDDRDFDPTETLLGLAVVH